MALTAIISDIHANLQALKSVMNHIERIGCDRIFCLGDMVGYGANPNECLDLLRLRKVQCIRGNHDRDAVSNSDIGNFNYHAWQAILYTRSVLSADNHVFLKSLPDRLYIDSTLLVHGSPDDPDSYITGGTNTIREAQKLYKSRGPGICYFGHTHHPIAADQDKIIDIHRGPIQMTNNQTMMLNPGSVGQPRDHSSDASYLIWDDQKLTVNFHRVPYDVLGAQTEILDAGLPEWLASRLDRKDKP